MKIVFKDEALPQTIPFSRIRTIFSFRNGIYTPIERVKLKYKERNPSLFFYHPDREYCKVVAEVDGLIPLLEEVVVGDYDLVVSSSEVDTFKLQARAKEMILADLEIGDRDRFLSVAEFETKFPNIEVIGDRSQLFVARDVTIVSRNVVFDTRGGVIVIDNETNILPFSYISGNVYVGRHSEIVNARLSYNSVIGNYCRVSGEVAATFFNDYSYKSHDGFIGNSVVGTWVNFGAMTTTSNLKNNYSEVTIKLPSSLAPNATLLSVGTGDIKFGSLIGDFVKTAIGTMINTGTVIDMGCNVLKLNSEKYFLPLRWIDNTQQYEKKRFISDTRYIVGRKGVELSHSFDKLVCLL